MTDEPTKTEVVDNELEDRFEIWYGDRLAGFSAYRRRAGATVFVHTEIADEFGGKGLGSVLAQRALDMTLERGETIVPVCPFIAAYLRKHPEYEEHVRWPTAQAVDPADPAGNAGDATRPQTSDGRNG
jgi:predicted GNAT family acetyltransferase